MKLNQITKMLTFVSIVFLMFINTICAEDYDKRINQSINTMITVLGGVPINLNRVIQIFGEPAEYTWHKQVFSKNDLPPTYFLVYTNGLCVLMKDDCLQDLRFTKPGFVYRDKLQVGSSLDVVFEVMGQPIKTVVGQDMQAGNRVFCKDINGRKGYCYYANYDLDIKVFLHDYRVVRLLIKYQDILKKNISIDDKHLPHTNPKEENNIRIAKEFIQLLANGDFSTACNEFDYIMSASMSEKRLKEIWDSLTMQNGDFQQYVDVRIQYAPNFIITFVVCKFEKNILDIKVVFNEDDKITGLFFLPNNDSIGYESPPYVNQSSFHEENVMIVTKTSAPFRDKWDMPGTVSVPNGNGPFPGIVLIHGSGPHDRDESIGPNKPFRDLAWGLASQGVCVLRFEKRTKRYANLLAWTKKDFTVKEEVIDDALNAVSLLRNLPIVNDRKTFILGHSLGAMLAPRIVEHDPNIAGIIMMAGNTKSLETLIIEQKSYISSLDGIITENEKKQLEMFKKEVQKIHDPEISSIEHILGAPKSYWVDLANYNAIKTARSLIQPIFILQGGRDYQVNTENFDQWEKTLGNQTNVSFKLYPKLNHLFIEGEGKSTPEEYQIINHIAPYVINDIAVWVKSK